MKAPLKVLICWVIIVIALVVVVFYRYDLIAGIKRTMAEANTRATTPAAATIASIDPGLANGKKLFEEKTCVLCHGANGKADTPTGQVMKATDLTSGKFHNNTGNLEASAYILKVIDDGVPGTAMVSFKTQIPVEQDRKDLASYVHSFANGK